MKIVATEKAPAALGPYSQGYTHGGMFYSAGQLGADPATGDLQKESKDRQTVHARIWLLFWKLQEHPLIR